MLTNDFKLREWVWAGAMVAVIQALLVTTHLIIDEEILAYLAAWPAYLFLALAPRNVRGTSAFVAALIANLVLFTPLMVGILRSTGSRAKKAKQ